MTEGPHAVACFRNPQRPGEIRRIVVEGLLDLDFDAIRAAATAAGIPPQWPRIGSHLCVPERWELLIVAPD